MVQFWAKVFKLNVIVHWAKIKLKFSHSLRLVSKFPVVGRSSTAQVRQKWWEFSKDEIISNWPHFSLLVIIKIPVNPPQIYYGNFMLWGIENLNQLPLGYVYCIVINDNIPAVLHFPLWSIYTTVSIWLPYSTTLQLSQISWITLVRAPQPQSESIILHSCDFQDFPAVSHVRSPGVIL